MPNFKKNNDRPGGSSRSSRDSKPTGSFSKSKSFSKDKPSSDGEKRAFSGERPSSDGPRKRITKDRPTGDREDSFSKDKKPFGTKSSFGGARSERPKSDRPTGSFSRDKKPFGDKPESGERKSFSKDRPTGDRNNSAFSRDKKPFGDKPGFDGERRSFSKDKPTGDRNNSSFSRDKKPFGDKPGFDGEKRSFSKDRPTGDKDNSSFSRDKKPFGEKNTFGGERKSFSKDRNLGQDDKIKSTPGPRGKRDLTKKEDIETPEYDFNPIRENRAEKKQQTAAVAGEGIRLNRFIANSGICSRRDADVLIEAGEISVNGKVIDELGFRVQQGDIVRHNGATLKREKLVYVLLNKPKDFITTTNDPEERKTVMDLVANAANERLYPVGRLDRNTTGLLLLTNDGELADRLSHPSNNIKKIYQVDLDKPITDEDFAKIQAGVTLFDGFAKPDDLAIVGNERRSIGIEIHIGRNRIVRRIFESLDYKVERLDRVMYAGLSKKDLPRGNWRYLTESEVINLKLRK